MSLSHSLLGESAPGGKATILSCLLNLSSTCMGTGLLSLPFAFSQSGFTAGCALCVAAACTCGLSLYMLVDCGRKLRGPVSLAAVCEAALPGMGITIDLAVIGNCLGTAASYFIVAADCFSALGAPRQLVVVLSMVVTTAPALFRSMDTLKASSAVAIGCLACIVLLVVCFGFGLQDPCPGHSDTPHGHCGGQVEPFVTAPLPVFCTLPYFMMAFSCQANSFNAIGELSSPTPARERAVAMLVPIAPLMLYLTIAACGYLTFGNHVPSNIINGYPNTPVLALARAVLGVVMLCNVPLNIFPSRVSTLSLMQAFSRARDSAARPAVMIGTEVAEAPRLFVPAGKERRLTILFLGVTGGTALVVSDLGTVVAVIGSTGATMIALVCPPAAHLLLARRGKDAIGCSFVLDVLAATMLVLGLAIVPSKLFCA